MCGRYNITEDPENWRAVFEVMTPVAGSFGPFTPRYNVAPSEPPLPPDSQRKAPQRVTRVPILRTSDNEVVADSVVWPLIPFWARGEVPKYSTANARSEDMREKNAYRGAWARGQRCLIYANGFYEWQAVADQATKQPWLIELLNEPAMVFGGLWERSKTRNGEDVHSCTIVTLPANAMMREIHNAGRNRHRMPLILPRDHWRVWLEGTQDDAYASVQAFPADEMCARPVSRAVNNPNFDDPTILTEAPEAPAES